MPRWLGTGVYMAMRALGIGPVGTLVASGALKERQRVILAEFVNRSADSTLGPTLTEAFRVDLAQSPTVKLMDAKAVGDALRRMQRDPGALLAPDLAREVAEREGVTAVVQDRSTRWTKATSSRRASCPSRMVDRKSTRLNSSHIQKSRMPSSA